MEENFHKNEFGKTGSLPPRGTIHNLKAEKLSTENNLGGSIYMIIGSIAFILIIAAVIYYQFYFKSLDTSSLPADDITNGVEKENPLNNDDKGVGQDNQDSEGDTDNKSPDEIVEQDDNKKSPANDDEIFHVVQAGENLFRISLRYYGGNYSNELAAYNGFTDPNGIFEGFKLRIPKLENLSIK